MSLAALTASPTTFGPPLVSPISSSNSKTAAFFASPFSDPPVPPSTPSSSKSKTDAFFSTSFSALPTPLPSSSKFELTPLDNSATKSNPPPPLTRSRTADFFSSPSPRPTPHPSPLALTHSLPGANADGPAPPAPPRSLTASFFSAPSESKPDPPPSLRSVSSIASIASSTFPSPTESSFSSHDPQDRKARLPPLARLFPSRYNSIARSEDSDHDFTSSPSPRVRDFVELEVDGGQPSGRSPRSAMIEVASPSNTAVFPSTPTAPESETHVHAAPSNVFRTGSIVRPALGDQCVGHEYELLQLIGHGAFSRVWKAQDKSKGKDNAGEGALVAVKMVARSVGNSGKSRERDRMRASFVREVEILMTVASAQRLSSPAPHPSIPFIVASFTIPSHHVLVLPLIPGGELLSVINSDEQHARMTEGFVKRAWEELAGAVQWMHSKNVVHRDIKLENILLTSNPLSSPDPSLPPPGEPLIKLTDFGLARVIDPADPWLITRCGSESYAAPELIIAGTVSGSSDFLDEDQDEAPAWEVYLSRAPSDATTTHTHTGAGSSRSTIMDFRTEQPSPVQAVTPRREGAYDGRETDAWALGVVLFALVTRRLPFEPPSESASQVRDGSRERGEAQRKRERRAWLMRIARGEWSWPEDADLYQVHHTDNDADEDAPPSPVEAEGGHDDLDGSESIASLEGEDVGPSVMRVTGTGLALLPHVRHVVERLLVRNPRKRATVAEVVGGWETPQNVS
ncbi:kinase-like protein [Dentipellis sp. KUC8613]|nr:kinase-like protein [Dentipellis sp. KUC8613]